MNHSLEISIDGHVIGQEAQPYFIADIAANHDGDLNRAKDLIYLAAEAGAHAAKFQHFHASTLVSDIGFRQLGGKFSHQKSWSKSVYEVYEDASINLEWTTVLSQTCRDAKISFLSTPYSIELADHISPFVSAYKIGSGDINYIQLISHVAATNKPWIIATGASTLGDVRNAIQATAGNGRGVLMQCNTNYTASSENFRHLNLRVLETFRIEFPNLILGLSDHTLGHTSILGALAMGARVFEKHFTDDNERSGPDHVFSMNPRTWREMVDASTDLFHALGDGIKRVEENEDETVVLQRRCIRARRNLRPGDYLDLSDVDFLRPAPSGSIAPSQIESVKGRKVVSYIAQGEHVTWSALE